MDLIDFKRELYQTLKTIHPHHESGVQISVRCPFCGDSVKHSESTHFGIKLDLQDENEPVMYNCFLCHEGGILTKDVLHLLDVHDIQITTGMDRFNKNISKDIKRMGYRDNQLELKVPIPEDNDLNGIKKLYIEERLGRAFTYEELVQLKTVFSLQQFLVDNQIDHITCSPHKARELNNHYVGWLTIRNEKIIFRQVLNSSYKRYEKYEIYRRLNNTQKFYTIPNRIDITIDEPIYLVISEGVFDLWGVYFHVFQQQLHNTIYAAAAGSGYVAVIKYFIRQGLIDNIHLIIISDNEPHRTLSFYRDMLKDVLIWIDTTTIYYNDYEYNGKIEKDFGVPKSRIRVKKRML